MANSNFKYNGTDLDTLLLKKTDIVNPYVGAAGLYTWGYGVGVGQLGQNSPTDNTTPMQVGSLTTWAKVVSGQYSMCAVKADGTLWVWGRNNEGQLGLSDRTNRSSPVQVGSLTNWKSTDYSIDSTWFSVAAIKTDGTLWMWGSNDNGQLGLNDTTFRSSPVQVGSLTNWSKVALGNYHTVAIKTDGTLWTWGRNDSGNLGLGDVTPRSSPVQVGSLTNWNKIDAGQGHCHAIKTDGTLWAWGLNAYGVFLGIGTTGDRSSPVQVGSLTTWNGVATGFMSAVAQQSDGTLWTWGDNGYYALGLNQSSATRIGTPTQVGTLTNWSNKISVGVASVGAIKSDGTLWTFGGGWGDLGLVSPVQTSSPVQVGIHTNWSLITSGGYAKAGIKS